MASVSREVWPWRAACLTDAILKKLTQVAVKQMFEKMLGVGEMAQGLRGLNNFSFGGWKPSARQRSLNAGDPHKFTKANTYTSIK